MQQHKFIILPIEEKYAVRKRAMFPYATIDMFDNRLTNSRSVLFQCTDISKDFVAVDTIGFACCPLFFQFVQMLDDFRLSVFVTIKLHLVHRYPLCQRMITYSLSYCQYGIYWDFIAINWAITFIPKGVENNLEPNNGVQIDNTKISLLFFIAECEP